MFNALFTQSPCAVSHRRTRPGRFSARRQPAFTLVEMLVSVAITLVMMAAVVTLFANITDSVRNRRATIEMSGQLRHVRNMLQQDLRAATCPGVTWQRPESNHGYIELIEGIYRDAFPSMLTDGNTDSDGSRNQDIDGDGVPDFDELDPKLSNVPRNSGVTDTNGNGRIDDAEVSAYLESSASLTGLNGLGDYDDVLMFTARNEHEPYIGRSPDYANGPLAYTSVESPLAEIIWFAIENPTTAENNVAQGFFGEPGMRTVYRRALLIAPWLDPLVGTPGVLELLPPSIGKDRVDRALAALIRFQDTYDLSARVEWDPLANGGSGQWKILANTLADLTKRENRFGHYGFVEGSPPSRRFPYPIASQGMAYGSATTLAFVDENGPVGGITVRGYAPSGLVVSYGLSSPLGTTLQFRPLVYAPGGTLRATPNAMLNDDGAVIRVVNGPVPLWGKRRGQDVMLTNVLAFDLRVYDPGAPIYMETTTQTALEPSDPGWSNYYNPVIGNSSGSASFVGQGAYVDMGYAFHVNPLPPPPTLAAGKSVLPWFAEARPLFHASAAAMIRLPPASHLAPGYAVYDTWSFSYENNGINEDGDVTATGEPLVDEGTNGLDDDGQFGPDDVGERETAPPYDKPLRGIQVVLRVYETDSRQIQQVRVNQHFLAE